jgi:alkylated DNA repair dioxygenase AlkB
MGDIPYRYSKKKYLPTPWTPCVSALRGILHDAHLGPFNGVLLNHYRNGQDSMGRHRDLEPELGPRPQIASLSLGETRNFELWPDKKYHADHIKKIVTPLESGSLLLMTGDSQKHWLHAIPKSPRQHTPRINLTFRQVH